MLQIENNYKFTKLNNVYLSKYMSMFNVLTVNIQLKIKFYKISLLTNQVKSTGKKFVNLNSNNIFLNTFNYQNNNTILIDYGLNFLICMFMDVYLFVRHY